MELHRFFRYAIEKMCKEKKSLNHFKEIKWSDKNIIELIPLNQINAQGNLVQNEI